MSMNYIYINNILCDIIILTNLISMGYNYINSILCDIPYEPI